MITGSPIGNELRDLQPGVIYYKRVDLENMSGWKEFKCYGLSGYPLDGMFATWISDAPGGAPYGFRGCEKQELTGYNGSSHSVNVDLMKTMIREVYFCLQVEGGPPTGRYFQIVP